MDGLNCQSGLLVMADYIKGDVGKEANSASLSLKPIAVGCFSLYGLAIVRNSDAGQWQLAAYLFELRLDLG